MFHFFVYLFLELFDSGVHLLCDFRMLCCHIVTLLGVGFHVEEGKADVSAFGNLFAGQSVLTGSFYDAVAMRNISIFRRAELPLRRCIQSRKAGVLFPLR